MVKIRSHLSNDEYKLKCNWPDNATVQWGGHGLVVGKNPYQTAFFEVFTPGGFIRGEGKVIGDAEESAFRQFQKEMKCASSNGHTWTRALRLKDKETRLRKGRAIPKTNTYTNAGSFCLKCGKFSIKVFKPIVKLGEWKKPISYSELNAIMDGMTKLDWDYLKTLSNDELNRTIKYKRKLELRAHMFGIILPDPSLEIYQNDKSDLFTESRYEKDCREAVMQFYIKYRANFTKKSSVESMEGLFDSLTIGILEREYKRYQEQNGETENTPSL